MGRRKSKAKVVKKIRRKTATVFDCPFCNHRQSCEVKFDHKAQTALIRCRICTERFQMKTNNLTEPIDVYSEWIDETERVNKDDEEYEREVGESMDKALGNDQDQGDKALEDNQYENQDENY
mmetsp:Transcript_10240/g.12219  ORF Transcript_10240/g.12219 Transcript_10240/m.12219 type:complete len:122 (+) Transcript_10240:46-411(+)|eukprot:jgi/Bigna1/49144/estExt_Genewise1.C_400033